MSALRRLTPKSPALIGVVYLALIPLFGALYATLEPRSFRDTNIESEKAIQAEGRGLAVALGPDVAARTREGRWKVGGLELHLDRRSIRVGNLLHTQDGRLLLEVTGGFVNDDRHGFGSFDEWVDLDVGFGGFLETVDPRSGPPTVSMPVTLTLPEPGASSPAGPVAVGPPVSVLFPAPGLDAGTESESGGVLTVPLRHYDRLVRFFNAVQGDPYYAPHRALWTVYFSAVTATTLGFGDITPVSAEARFLTGAEAVLGLVVIGLFLNALAGKASGRRSRSTDHGDVSLMRMGD